MRSQGRVLIRQTAKAHNTVMNESILILFIELIYKMVYGLQQSHCNKFDFSLSIIINSELNTVKAYLTLILNTQYKKAIAG